MRRSSLTKLYMGSGRAIIERKKYINEYKRMTITVFWNFDTCRQHILGACRRRVASRVACRARRGRLVPPASGAVWEQMSAGRYTDTPLTFPNKLNSTYPYKSHSLNSIGAGINNLYRASRRPCGWILSQTKNDSKEYIQSRILYAESGEVKMTCRWRNASAQWNVMLGKHSKKWISRVFGLDTKKKKLIYIPLELMWLISVFDQIQTS